MQKVLFCGTAEWGQVNEFIENSETPQTTFPPSTSHQCQPPDLYFPISYVWVFPLGSSFLRTRANITVAQLVNGRNTRKHNPHITHVSFMLQEIQGCTNTCNTSSMEIQYNTWGNTEKAFPRGGRCLSMPAIFDIFLQAASAVGVLVGCLWY